MSSKLLVRAAMLALVGTAPAFAATGPSSSQSPYVIGVNGTITKSIMTVGDSVNLKPDGVTPYRMVGIPDGLGAYDNGNGTFTLLMNHELGDTAGVARAHGAAGAFVSQWTIRSSDLTVLNVKDFIVNTTSIFLSNNNPAGSVGHSGFHAGSTTVISRLCSADLAPASAYGWTDTNTNTFYGTDARIFQSGEESSGSASAPAGAPEATVLFGRQFAFIATDDSAIGGNQANTAYELPHAGLFSWENNLASPHAQRKTIVMGMDDSNGGQIYVWVGEKQTTGNVVERAGLTKQSANDGLFVVSVNNLGAGPFNETRTSPFNGTFSLASVNGGDVSGLSLPQTESATDLAGGEQFLRPEDGHWDPSNPNRFWFVTTDRFDEFKNNADGSDADANIDEVGRSRLYALDFTDITNPTAGGTITAFLDGTEGNNGGFGPNMLDNMTAFLDANGNTQLLLQEDVGAQAHNGKIWLYNPANDQLTLVAKHDPARFGDLGMAATAPYNNDEESSGVIDARDFLGLGWFLADVQAHYSITGELVQGGQLFAFYVPSIPTPAALPAGLALLSAMGLRRSRR
jgi:hypothetical protein